MDFDTVAATMDAPRLERLASGLLKAGIAAAPLLCVAGVFLITAGTDECWILSGIRGLAETGTYAKGAPFRSVHSTGGAYTLVMTLLYKLGGGRLEILRMASVAGLAGILWIFMGWAGRSAGKPQTSPWIAASALFALPGTFMLGSQAYGEILATLLLLAGAFLWTALPGESWGRRLGVGVLLGAAAATRINCLVALAALPLAAVLYREKRRAEVLDAAVAVAAGAIVFYLQWNLLWWLSADPASRGASQSSFSRGMPWSHPLAYVIPLFLSYWSIGRDFLPFFVLAMISAGWIVARPRLLAPRGGDFLLATGWLLWLAWHVQSPIPHLRYVWPGLACFAALAGLELSVLYEYASETGSTRGRTAVLMMALSFLVTGYADGARTMERGDGDVLSWEWHRATSHRFVHGPFRAIRSQKAFVERLKRIPEQERIATAGFDTALSYLTRRPIYNIGAYYADRAGAYADYQDLSGLTGGPLPHWVVVTPFVYLQPSSNLHPALYRWVEENCRLEAAIGPYLLYEVKGRFPSASATLELDTWEPRLPLVTTR